MLCLPPLLQVVQLCFYVVAIEIPYVIFFHRKLYNPSLSYIVEFGLNKLV